MLKRKKFISHSKLKVAVQNLFLINCFFYSTNIFAVSGNITVSAPQSTPIVYDAAAPAGQTNTLTVTSTGPINVSNGTAVTFQATAAGPNTVLIQAGGQIQASAIGFPNAIFIASGGAGANTPVTIIVSGTVGANGLGVTPIINFSQSTGDSVFQLNPGGNVPAAPLGNTLYTTTPANTGNYSFIFAGGTLNVPFGNNNDGRYYFCHHPHRRQFYHIKYFFNYWQLIYTICRWNIYNQ